MAQFDVYRRPGTRNLLVDCQSDLLSDLPTRFLIPLLCDVGATVSPRFNPEFIVAGERYILAPQLALSAPLDRLGEMVASLRSRHDEIIRAIDVLLGV